MLMSTVNDVKSNDREDELNLAPEKNPSKNLPERCMLKPDGGPCKALFERYYFDEATGKCQMFFYGGCNGTVPFETMDECEYECTDKRSEKEKAIDETGSGEW
ncbi:MAG: hypothetical protein C4538_07535 [Nitrospiraceae bacterium]|nr:MAG: hypothetical protein C4538_07535 [Nitrospiraceae bacterium]